MAHESLLWEQLFYPGECLKGAVLTSPFSTVIFTPAVASIAHFLYTRRANATAIAAAGGSFGRDVIPLMLQALIPRIGLR